METDRPRFFAVRRRHNQSRSQITAEYTGGCIFRSHKSCQPQSSISHPRVRLTWGFLAGIVLLLGWATPVLAQTAEPSPQEKEIDQQQLRQIYQAIQAYRKDHGDLPTWLSDLVPKYLPDAGVLVSPVEERTGRSVLWGYADPKARTSYVYEFGGNPAGGSVNEGREKPLTMKEWKTLQMEEFGPAIPLLRCHLYNPVLNVAYSGDFYETSLFWETDTNTLALAKRLGLGPGSKEEKWMTVKAVDGESGQPLADVEVTATNRRSTLGPLPPRMAKTGTTGQCRVPLGWGTPQTLALDFAKQDYAATPLSWNESTGQNLPEEVTANLKPAVLIGGIVRSREGKPIAGATVTVSGVVHDQSGQALLAAYDTVQTGADGKWTSRRVPKDFATLNFKLSHPEFLPAEYDQSEGSSPGQNEVAKADLLAAGSPMVMRPAIHIEGAVSRGTRPVAGARVVLRDSADSPTNRVQHTDAQGRFRFVVLEEGAFALAVEAEHASPALQHLSVKSGFKPLAISLEPSKTIHGRVTDENGEPVDKAEVSVTAWQDLPILQWRTTTDAQGRFTWDAAPDDSVTLSVSKSGYNVMARVTADSTEPVAFQLSKSFRLEGSVVDADTGAPLKTFRLLRGMVWNPGDTNQVNWERGAETSGREGRYAINGLQPNYGGMSHLKFMVLADGYLPQTTPTLSSSGWHTNDFALHKGQGAHGIVKLADGRPVEGAEVALLGMGYVSLGKGAFRQLGGNNDTFIAHTDANGAFALPAVLPSPTILAVHAEGFAEITGDQLATNDAVVLEPWGKVEGTAWLSHEVATNEEVMLTDGTRPGQTGINFDWSAYKTNTDSQGRFAFSFVPPGKRQVVRLIPQGGGSWMWADQTPVTVKPDKTTTVKVGGSGRRIVGRAVASDSAQKIDWESGRFNLHTEFPRPPGPFKSQQEAEEWNNLPATRAAREQYKQYPVSMRSDGSFRLDNVPAGKYTLDLVFTEPQEGRPMGMGQTVGRISKEVTLAGDSADPARAPLDLGTLELKTAASLSAGKPAPEIQGEDVDGVKFKLSDYRGKVVLIDFWGDW